MVLFGTLTINSLAFAITVEHNLSRFTAANSQQQNAIIKETLDKINNYGALIVPYATSADKSDAILQIRNCVAPLAKKFPGQSIGTAIKACCEHLSYYNL